MGVFKAMKGALGRVQWSLLAVTWAIVGCGSRAVLAEAAPSVDAGREGDRPFLLAQATSTPITRMLFVNPSLGDDQTGEGTLRSPFRSITRAIQFAEPNTTLILAGGTYSQRTGEQFPIGLPSGVSLLEDPAASSAIVIAGQVLEGSTPPASNQVARSAPTPSARPATIPESLLESVSVPGSIPLATPGFSPAPTTPIARPAPALNPVEPIVIPVTAPQWAVVPPAQPVSASTSFAVPTANAPISILVPAPERPASVQTAWSAPAATPTPVVNMVLQNAAPVLVPNANLLPVPDPNIPLGYVGDMPRVRLPEGIQQSPVRSGGASRTTVSAVPQGLRYRVLVRPTNEATRAWVLSLVPDAFETVSEGERMLQIGAFRDRENAEEAAELLSQSGVRALVQQW